MLDLPIFQLKFVLNGQKLLDESVNEEKTKLQFFCWNRRLDCVSWFEAQIKYLQINKIGRDLLLVIDETNRAGARS